MMLQILTVAACLTVSVWGLCFYVRRAVETLVTHRLHSIRGRLYNIGLADPEIRTSLLYKDIEYLLTAALVAAKKSGLASAEMHNALSGGAKPTPKPSETWRSEQYRRELRTLDIDMLTTLLTLPASAANPLLIRSITAHPLSLGFSMIVFVVTYAHMTIEDVAQQTTAQRVEAQIMASNAVLQKHPRRRGSRLATA